MLREINLESNDPGASARGRWAELYGGQKLSNLEPNSESRLSPPVTDQEFNYLDDSARMLPGWPGYRNRPGRSGLDYLDSEFELAHMEGVFIRALITGRLRTEETAYLILMGSVAGFCLLLFSLPLIELLLGGYVYPIAWCYTAFPGALGILLLWNLVLNLLRKLS